MLLIHWQWLAPVASALCLFLQISQSSYVTPFPRFSLWIGRIRFVVFHSKPRPYSASLNPACPVSPCLSLVLPGDGQCLHQDTDPAPPPQPSWSCEQNWTCWPAWVLVVLLLEFQVAQEQSFPLFNAVQWCCHQQRCSGSSSSVLSTLCGCACPSPNQNTDITHPQLPGCSHLVKKQVRREDRAWISFVSYIVRNSSW